jgi:ELWxxDGT repeat protein
MSLRHRLTLRPRSAFAPEQLEGRVLLAASPTLVKDLNNSPTAGLSQAEHVAVGSGAVVLFRSSDPAGGLELWRSDGTDAGTFRLKDINPGPGSSAPSNLANLNGVVYFSADDGASGHELWRSDGTAAGTVRVKDLNPGAAGSMPQELTAAANGKLYFSADDGAPGLWQSDGTAAGTVRLKQFTDSPGIRPSEFRWFNGGLIFRGVDAAAGMELWRSDGTAAGTARLADIFPGASHSFPHGIRTVGSTIVFGANDGVRGFEIWTTDGTAAGTRLVSELAPGAGSIYLHSPVEMNGAIYFGGTLNGSTWDLYRTDGTAAGTRLVKDFGVFEDISLNNRVVAHGGAVYFQVNRNGNLWRSDGTEAGTVAVTDLDGTFNAPTTGFIAPLGARVYFTAGSFRTAGFGGELLAVDASGLVDPNVVEPATGRTPYFVMSAAAAGGRLFVAARETGPGVDGAQQGAVQALWRTDGTPAGTTVARNAGGGTASGGNAFDLAAAGNKVFFTPSRFNSDVPLWVSDGTAAGTIPLPEKVQPLSEGLGQAVSSGGLIYFTNWHNALARSDGTPGGTFHLNAIAANKFDFNGKLLFSGHDSNLGYELFTSDGTVAGTTLLKDLLPGIASSLPRGFAVMNGLAYFTTTDGGTTGGRLLWRTDGTAAGTIQITGVPHNPDRLVAAGNRLYWANGATLYATDGTAAGTAALRTMSGGSASIANLVDFNGTLLFAGSDANGTDLWRSNGTAAGTVRITDPGGGGGLYAERQTITVAGQYAYFVGGDGTSEGYGELWVTDGTTGGTRLLKNLVTFGSSWPRSLVAVGNTLYFLATESFHGEELWRTDGTTAGTVVASDVFGGPASSSIHGMVAVGNTLFLAGDDGVHGHELFKLDPAAAPPPAQPVTLRAPADAYVRDGADAAVNFGTATELHVKRSSTVGNTREAYLRFDLSSVPTVGSAKLRLFGKLSNTVNPSVVTTVYNAAGTTWGEAAVTWDTKPAAGTTSRGTITVAGTTAKWYELDLTGFLKAEKAAGRNLVTLVLKNGTVTDALTVFNSDEATANRPELVVTPEGPPLPPPPPQQGLVVSTTSLNVQEGSQGSFTVRLAIQPTHDIKVAFTRNDAGDPDIRSLDEYTFFTPDNWNVPQVVRIQAEPDGDAANGTAVITVSSAALPSKAVTVTEIDDDVPPPPPPPPPPPTGPVTLRAGADAYVRDGTSAGLNFGTSTQLQARKGATVNNNRDTYLRFDLSSVPLADIGTAKLRLNGRLDSTAAASAGFTVFSATNTTWSETALTWNNKPASGTTSRGSATVTGTTAKWYEVNLTTFLKAEKAAGRNVVTLVIKATAASAATILFNSDEATASRPELVIAPPPQGIVTSASTLNVAEGGSASFTVKLAVKPTANVVVNLAKSSTGDADLGTATTSLVFTPDNWSVAQTVLIAAAQDADTANGTAAFTLSSPGLPNKTVTATEADNDIVRLRAAADAYVRDGTSAGTNFGTATQLQARRGATAGNNREAYLRFNLTSMTVATAKLRLNAKLDGTAAASAGFTVYSSTNTTWGETGLTWNNRPAAGAAALRSATVSGTTSKWYELDLTDFLKAERAAGRTAVTLVIRASAASAATVLFNSDEATGSRPELVVTSL